MKRLIPLIPAILLVLSSTLLAQDRADVTVENMVICTSVQHRQPVGADSVFNPDVGRLYCYTKIMSFTDTTAVSHVWFYEGRQMAKIDLPVKAKTWRTWSSKKILPRWKGDWRVEVQDESGKAVSQIAFKIM